MELDRIIAKKAFNKLMLIFILYNIAFGIVYNISSMGIASYMIINNPSIELPEIESFIYNTGFALIASATVSVLIAFLCSRTKPQFQRNKKIDLKSVIMLFIIIQGLQLMCSIILVPLQGLFYQAGYSFDDAISAASDPSIYFSSLIYSVIVAPVMEELFFRGLVMKKMESYGRVFAIVVSAMLFSLMHQNIVQMPITFAMGILFGYIATEYSLITAIGLHLLNNAFVEISGQLRNTFEYAWLFDSLFMYACGVITIVLVVLNFKNIKAYMNNEKSENGTVKLFFTRPLVILVIIYYMIMTLLSVSVI